MKNNSRDKGINVSVNDIGGKRVIKENFALRSQTRCGDKK